MNRIHNVTSLKSVSSFFKGHIKKLEMLLKSVYDDVHLSEHNNKE